MTGACRERPSATGLSTASGAMVPSPDVWREPVSPWRAFLRRSRGSRRLAALWWFALMPLAAATMEEGLALKRAQDLPAAARVFSALVAANPKDVDALEQLATVTGWQERHAEALALWERAIVLAPDYAGLRVSRARVLYWMGRLDEARDQIVLLLSGPDAPSRRDLEAWILAGDIARARREPEAAYGYYTQALVLDATSELAQGKLRQVQLPRRWRLDAGGMLDSYHPASDTVVQRGHEQTAYLQLGRQVSDRLTLALGADYAHEFGEVDWRYNAEAYWSPRDDLSLQARAALTPQADVLANWEALVGADWRASSSVAVLLTVRASDFDAERIVTFMPGLRLGGTTTVEARVFYTISDVNDATSAAVLKVATTWREQWHPYALVSYGKENQPPVGVARTASAAAGMVVDVSPALSLRFDGLYEWREDIHRRVSLGGGVTFRF